MQKIQRNNAGRISTPKKDSLPPTAQNQVFPAQHRKTVPSSLISCRCIGPPFNRGSPRNPASRSSRCSRISDNIPALAVMNIIPFRKNTTLVFQIHNPNQTIQPPSNASMQTTPHSTCPDLNLTPPPLPPPLESPATQPRPYRPRLVQKAAQSFGSTQS